MRGHSYLPGRAAALLTRRRARGASTGGPGLEVLSSRERAAIELYARGFSAIESGAEMLVSPKTAEGYVARAKSKLGLGNRRDIVHFALETGLLRPDAER